MIRCRSSVNIEQGSNIMMRNHFLSALLAGTAASLPSAATHAAGTAAGTSINNTATVGYSVGGTPQAAVTSNTATFLVDRKVDLAVAESGGAATATLFGAVNQVTTFTVTNNGNATQDFRLVAAQQTTLAPTAFGHVDNYNVANVRVFADANGNGTYEAGTDVLTFIDELAADATRAVFIVADVPTTGPSNPFAGVSLTAVAAIGGGATALGADVTATLGVDSPTVVDTVFADDTGLLDGLRDGQDSALDEYIVATAAIALAKTARIVSDPFNGIIAPKAIPGAIVEYCLRVTNSGPGTATDVVLSDTVPGNTTYLPGSIFAGGTVTGGACIIDGTPEDDNATGIDEADLNGGSSDGTSVSASVPLVLPSTTVTARFRVTLN